MPMTREERLELLKLAREAKAKKKLERDNEKPVVKRGRKKKDVEEPMEAVVEEPEKMEVEPEPEPEADDFDLVIQPVEKKTRAKKPPKEPVRSLELEMPDDEPEIIYETEIRKKPKKKIVKKIIYESDSDDDVEEVVVENKPKKASAKVKKVAKPVPLEAPKEPEVKGFNFFNC